MRNVKACIVVANAFRGRIFTVEPFREVTGETRYALIERHDLVNPASRLTDGELFSSTASGARGRPGREAGRVVRSQPLDDHRRDHVRELDRRFAEAVVEAALDVAPNGPLHLVAGPRVLGRLRRALASRAPDASRSQFPKDLVGLEPRSLRLRLVDEGILPEQTVRP